MDFSSRMFGLPAEQLSVGLKFSIGEQKTKYTKSALIFKRRKRKYGRKERMGRRSMEPKKLKERWQGIT
ncbi:MAG: hypothetical protein RQ753_06920 [Desulfurivibrionaceae bacterium]|nr:hypothetical protein [Desulfurivibrionaceae bacterium]